MNTRTLITELQSFGLRLVDPEGGEGAPGRGWASRRGGAGPSDHVAATVLGATVMIPVHTGHAATSPFVARVAGNGAGTIERDGAPIAPIRLARAPRFYALSTRDGTPYHQIALLHGTDVLASTVLQTCIRYADPERACTFCAIGQSLEAGRTLAKKTPEQLAEVAVAAAELDGITHVTLTTGTPRSADRGAAHLADCARAIKAHAGLPVQAQCEPPDDFAWFERMRAAGVDSLGMHLEAVEPAVRAAVMPGKAEIPLARYFEAFEAAVRVFGRGQVSTYLIAGLGDAPETLIATSERLVAIGVYPFIVPLVPIRGTRAAHLPPPSGELMRSLYSHVGPLLARAGLERAQVKAGCARCGACSALPSFETTEAPNDAELQLRVGAAQGRSPGVPPLAPSRLLRRTAALRGDG